MDVSLWIHDLNHGDHSRRPAESSDVEIKSHNKTEKDSAETHLLFPESLHSWENYTAADFKWFHK